MTHFRFWHDFVHDEGGATAVEYGLILALIFITIVAAVNLFAGNFNLMFQAATDAITGAG